MKFLEFDVTIIGGGCIGASILSELTHRGFSHVGLLDHSRKTLSATTHSGGMLRVFHENSLHLELALSTHSLLERYNKAEILSQKPVAHGSLYFFNKSRYPGYQANLELMNLAKYPFEVLTPTSGRKKFPQILFNDDEFAIFEPLGSQLSPNLFVEDLISSSSRAGATVVDDFQVQRLSAYSDHYRISGENQTVTTRSLVLAGGARLLPRLRDLGLSFPLEAKRLTAFNAEKLQNCIETLPNYFDRESLEFGRLSVDSNDLISNPETKRFVDRTWRRPMDLIVADDCYSPGRIGFSGKVPGLPHLFLATGWGGTGFKFALEIGKRVVIALEKDQPERRKMYAQFQ